MTCEWVYTSNISSCKIILDCKYKKKKSLEELWMITNNRPGEFFEKWHNKGRLVNHRKNMNWRHKDNTLTFNYTI